MKQRKRIEYRGIIGLGRNIACGRKNEYKRNAVKTAQMCKELLWDMLFPRRCPICDGVLRFRKEYICPACLEKIKYTKEPVCMKCGKSLWEEEEYCYDCRNKRHLYVQGAAVFEYDSIASSLYRFKYGGKQEYAAFFGRCMASALEERMKRWNVQALVPVPIHPSRKRKRGYNQAQLLAEVISAQTGIPVRKDIIVRQRKTAPQKELDEKQRQNNLKKAFKILKNDVKLNTIVIIDDIYTTGSTIDAMTAILYSVGVGKVYYAALAIGRGL